MPWECQGNELTSNVQDRVLVVRSGHGIEYQCRLQLSDSNGASILVVEVLECGIKEWRVPEGLLVCGLVEERKVAGIEIGPLCGIGGRSWLQGA